jgi:hypothetical protein
MGKVSIGLRGWRFDEEAVFDDDGEFRERGEIPKPDRQRLARLSILVNAPCNACWLIHGEEDKERCEVAEVVYGEPGHEVIVCAEHEADFLYWFREEGGQEYVGEKELQRAFHEWFANGERAPAGYGGMEHVDTASIEDLPAPTVPTGEERAIDPPGEGRRVDIREFGREYPTGE